MKAKFIRIAKIILAITFIVASFSCKKEYTNLHNDKPPFNLDVALFGKGKNLVSFGNIKFRQYPDTARIINLGIRVFNLYPLHSYLLQRAVNPIADNTGCSSTAWLTLGNGLKPEAIHTDADGNGHADLWRNVSSIASGTSFHIHFQVVDSTNLTTVLTSDCYDYTVR